MWPFSKPKKEAIVEEPKIDRLEQHFQKTMKAIRELKKTRQQYNDLLDEIMDVVGNSSDEEIPISGKDGETLSLGRFGSHRILRMKDDVNLKTKHISNFNWEDVEEYSIDLLKRSFINWAEDKYGIGYRGLVGA